MVIEITRPQLSSAHSHTIWMRLPGGSTRCDSSTYSFISLDAVSFRAMRASRELMRGVSLGVASHGKWSRASKGKPRTTQPREASPGQIDPPGEGGQH
jgi:hypothetical protein